MVDQQLPPSHRPQKESRHKGLILRLKTCAKTLAFSIQPRKELAMVLTFSMELTPRLPPLREPSAPCSLQATPLPPRSPHGCLCACPAPGRTSVPLLLLNAPSQYKNKKPGKVGGGVLAGPGDKSLGFSAPTPHSIPHVTPNLYPPQTLVARQRQPHASHVHPCAIMAPLHIDLLW